MHVAAAAATERFIELSLSPLKAVFKAATVHVIVAEPADQRPRLKTFRSCQASCSRIHRFKGTQE